jgi:predicted Zn-dependent protease with MMP-like domain
MIEVSNERFQQLIDEALGEMPKTHLENLKNVAILYEDEPSIEQRQKLRLRQNQTLLGLYEGVPLAERQGQNTFLPDRITLFKRPICWASHDLASLKEQIKHTLWHEIAHYYGLDHSQIRDLES